MLACRYSSQEVEKCEEEYEARCEITFQPELRNVSRMVCSNTSSGSDLGEKERGEECEEVLVVITAQTPVETCTVNTKPRCQKVVETLPHLEAVEECVAVPREVCRQVRTRPRTRRLCSPPSVLLSVLP